MSRLISNIGVMASYLVIFTVTYMPVLRTHYFYRDDYYWIWPNTSKAKMKYLLSVPIGDGRALDGYSQYFVFDYLHYLQSVGSGSIIRFIGIIGLVLLAYVIFLIFKTNGVKSIYAFTASILICTLPAFQVHVSWIVLNPEICSVTLSALAGLLLFKVIFKGGAEKFLYRVTAIVTAVILIVISLNLYQPTAMFYWSVGVIPLVLLRDEDLTRKWHAPFAVYFSVGFIAMAVYFLIVKASHFLLDISVQSRGEFISLTVGSIYWKAKWFLSSALKNSLNLWNISPDYILAGVVGMFILGILLFDLRHALLDAVKEKKFNLLWNHSQRLFLILFLLPLSLSSTLAVRESWATYRTIISLETTICILFIISLIKIEEFLKSGTGLSDNMRKTIISVALIMLTVFAVYDAHGNVKKYFAGLQSFELEYIKDSIRNYGISNVSDTSEIYLREPAKKYHVDNLPPFEFGFPSSGDGYGTEIVNLALYELGVTEKIKIHQLLFGEPAPEDSDILIIDLSELEVILRKKFSFK